MLYKLETLHLQHVLRLHHQQIFSITFSSVFSFFSIEIDIDGAPSGSTPIILVLGDNTLKTDDKPAAKPPPPTGIKI